MNNNFFSIIIDTCNHEKWIEQCIQSCLFQKYDNYEIIIIDAISEDKTFEICKEYESGFSKIKLYQNEIRIPQRLHKRNFKKYLELNNG